MRYEIDDMMKERLENDFTYHSPHGDQPERYGILRSEAKVMNMQILRLTPKSREQSLALTKVEEAVFWANAAIARNEKSDAGEVDDDKS